MTPIIGLDGYFVQGFEIIGKHGRPLKADRRNVYSFRVGGKAYHAELHKVVWCARHRVNVMDVPKDYSFREVNGTNMVETFSDRMSSTRKALAQEVKVKREDYDFVETFARMAKGLLDGEPDAKAKIFSLLNSKRDECVRYARTASGGVSQQKAVLYTDKAIADNAGVDFVCVLSGETTPADLEKYTGTLPAIVVETFDHVQD